MINMKRVCLIGFDMHGDIGFERILTINSQNPNDKIERDAVKRAVTAALMDERMKEVLIVLGKRHTGEFTDPDKATKWTNRELFGEPK